MFFTEPLEFVADYIESIDQGLKKYDSKLTRGLVLTSPNYTQER